MCVILFLLICGPSDFLQRHKLILTYFEAKTKTHNAKRFLDWTLQKLQLTLRYKIVSLNLTKCQHSFFFFFWWWEQIIFHFFVNTPKNHAMLSALQAVLFHIPLTGPMMAEPSILLLSALSSK